MYEIDPGKALIIKKNGTVSMQEITTVKKACSFERIYFSRVMLKYIKKEKFRLILPAVLSAIEQDTDNTVFSYIKYETSLRFSGSSSGFLKPKKEKLHS
jgi:amidophosphoribosyltransferase